MREQTADLRAMQHRIEEEQATVADVKYMKQRAYNQARGRQVYDKALGRPPED